MFAFMKSFFAFLLILFAVPAALGQEARPVTLDPSDVEEIRRLIGRVADLEEMLQAQNIKIANMRNEIETLHRDLRESQEKNNRKLADTLTREDLKKVYDSINEVEKKRGEDNKKMLEEIEKMVEKLAKAAPTVVAPSNPGGDKPEKTVKPPKELPRTSTNTNNALVYTHTVARGESLSAIVQAYNDALKDQNKERITLEMVKKANPTININNIYVGQEILIPVPPDKK